MGGGGEEEVILWEVWCHGKRYRRQRRRVRKETETGERRKDTRGDKKVEGEGEIYGREGKEQE